MQQLVVSEVVGEVTSTAPNADLDQPTEVSFISSVLYFIFPGIDL
jgi:hypothetical protein